MRHNTLTLKRVIVILFSKWVFTCSKDFYNGIAGYGNMYLQIRLSDLHFCKVTEAKLSLCLIKHHTIRMHEEMVV
jgi:hypothetical protein